MRKKEERVKGKNGIALALDGAMTAMLVLLMADRYTGNGVHEWLGVLFFVVLAGHVYLNRAWWAAWRTSMRAHPVRAAVNVTTAFLVAGTAVSAVFVSETVFSFLSLHAGMSGRMLHMFFAHWALLAAGVHAGMYGARVSVMARQSLSPERRGRRTGRLVMAAALMLAACGVYAFHAREIIFPLFMQSSFMLWRDGDHMWRLLFDYAAVFHAAAWGAYVVSLLFGRLKGGKRV